MTLRDEYLRKIDELPTVSYNREQKAIARKIIEGTSDVDLAAVYSLLTRRVKTGFVFDEAPEVNHNALKNLCATYVKPSGEGMIDVIYVDPPYNTEATKKDGNDYKDEVSASKFIYRDKFTHDGWLNMMNERLSFRPASIYTIFNAL